MVYAKLILVVYGFISILEKYVYFFKEAETKT